MVAGLQAVSSVYESRNESRVKLVVPFKVRYERSEPFSSETVISENISRTGLCIITKQNIPMHTKIYLETPNGRFRALALVVHSTKNRVGLRILASKGTWLVK